MCSLIVGIDGARRGRSDLDGVELSAASSFIDTAGTTRVERASSDRRRASRRRGTWGSAFSVSCAAVLTRVAVTPCSTSLSSLVSLSGLDRRLRGPSYFAMFSAQLSGSGGAGSEHNSTKRLKAAALESREVLRVGTGISSSSGGTGFRAWRCLWTSGFSLCRLDREELVDIVSGDRLRR